jgi:hypothetical protein
MHIVSILGDDMHACMFYRRYIVSTTIRQIRARPFRCFYPINSESIAQDEYVHVFFMYIYVATINSES